VAAWPWHVRLDETSKVVMAIIFTHGFLAAISHGGKASVEPIKPLLELRVPGFPDITRC
jgi:hypothetical protein